MLMFNARSRLLAVVHKLDRRILPVISTVLVILAIGLLIRWLPGEWTLSTGRDGVVFVPEVAPGDVSTPRSMDAAVVAASMKKDWRISGIDSSADPASSRAA